MFRNEQTCNFLHFKVFGDMYQRLKFNRAEPSCGIRRSTFIVAKTAKLEMRMNLLISMLLIVGVSAQSVEKTEKHQDTHHCSTKTNITTQNKSHNHNLRIATARDTATSRQPMRTKVWYASSWPSDKKLRVEESMDIILPQMSHTLLIKRPIDQSASM